MHTEYSSDSSTKVRDQLDKAAALGLEGVCITDHMDFEFPNVERSGMNFEFDTDAYFDELTALKEEYSGLLKVNIGVELGLRNEPGTVERLEERCRKYTEAYPFDFVIGSTHCLEFTDPYYEEPYWTGRTPGEGIEEFFKAVYQNVCNYSDFDSCGHLDYLVRYVPERFGWDVQKDYRPEDFFDLTDMIFKKLIDSGRALECNSAGLKYGLGFAHPKDAFLRRYRELGGELITVGSDGHRPEHIAYGFESVSERLKSLGFRYYTVYTGRCPVQLPL